MCEGGQGYPPTAAEYSSQGPGWLIAWSLVWWRELSAKWPL